MYSWAGLFCETLAGMPPDQVEKMRVVEQEGKNIEEAIELALRELGTTRENVRVEVLDEGSRGLFGMGAKPVRIKVIEERSNNLGDSDVKNAHDILKRLLQLMDMQAEIEAEKKRDSVVLKLSGENVGLIIGRRGQTLNGIEYIVNLMANRNNVGSGRKVKVEIDPGGYRDKQVNFLTNLAMRAAEKVKLTGKEVVLEPMSSQERKIIHMALQDDADVDTVSEGDGYLRKVVVFSKRNSRRPSVRNRE